MKHIRSWIVRVVFGPAQSEAPAGVDQQMREDWNEIHEPTPDHRKDKP